ncbi:MAG: hypothetical protein JRN08_05390 [Nitrososphaerota archaeon]|nr:hypothetical protein [Nitrososphaerota archaeon]
MAEQSSIEVAEQILNQDATVRGYDALTVGEYWVVAVAIMQPVYLSSPKTVTTELTDKPQTVTMPIGGPDTIIERTLQPPNGVVRYHFRSDSSDEKGRVFRSFMSARAVRNYLAFVAEMPIPLRYVMMTKGFMWRLNFDIDQMRYHHLPDEANPDKAAVMYSEISASYTVAEALLAMVDPSVPLGRAISSVGRAVWNEDDEDAFLAAWRGVDVVSKEDYRVAKTGADNGRDELLRPYLEAEAKSEKNGSVRKVSDLAKVQISIQRRLGDVSEKRVSELNEVRGIIAHDVLGPKRFETIRQDKWEMIGIARRLIVSVVREKQPDFGLPGADRP